MAKAMLVDFSQGHINMGWNFSGVHGFLWQ